MLLMSKTEGLRVKELLEEQGLRMSDLADRLGTNQSNLSKSLAANPKLSTLQEVAKALKVELHELFTPNIPSRPTGIAVVGGRTYGLVDMLPIVQIPSYDNYAVLRKDVKAFISKSITDDKTNAFCALVNGYEMVSLVYDCGNKMFILTIYYGSGKSETLFFDKLEFAEWKNGKDSDPVWNLDDVFWEIMAPIENDVPIEYGDLTTPADREDNE